MEEICSTKPYILRALYEWCCDNGLTPHITVRDGVTSKLPRQYMQHGIIVLNISMNSCRNLTIDNQYISFSARFSGVVHEIFVAIEDVIAIYAKENSVGIWFSSDDSDEFIPQPIFMPGLTREEPSNAEQGAPDLSDSQLGFTQQPPTLGFDQQPETLGFDQQPQIIGFTQQPQTRIHSPKSKLKSEENSGFGQIRPDSFEVKSDEDPDDPPPKPSHPPKLHFVK